MAFVLISFSFLFVFAANVVRALNISWNGHWSFTLIVSILDTKCGHNMNIIIQLFPHFSFLFLIRYHFHIFGLVNHCFCIFSALCQFNLHFCYRFKQSPPILFRTIHHKKCNSQWLLDRIKYV